MASPAKEGPFCLETSRTLPSVGPLLGAQAASLCQITYCKRNNLSFGALALRPDSLQELCQMPLTAKILLFAVVAQVLLTLIILVLMGRERVPRIARGEIRMADVAVDRAAYPLKARLLSNSFDNQFQLPVLFYLGTILTLQIGAVGWIEVLLGWLFVASRYIHAGIHVTTNNLPKRFVVYCTGLVVLALFWLWLLIRILLA